MSRRTVNYIITIFAYIVVFYPLWTRYKNASWALDETLIFNIFPAFGLVAFSILWLHVMSGVFEPWLKNYINFERFVRNTAIIVFICIIMHPLLLFIGLDFKLRDLLVSGGNYIRLGVIGWILLITYDIGKILGRYGFFVRNWNKILLISTIGFLFTFFHSLGLGHDLQSGHLRIVWIFYGITAISGTIYIYGIKRFFISA